MSTSAVYEKIKQAVCSDIFSLIPNGNDPACIFLMKSALENKSREQIQAVLDVLWEQLNSGHWSKVPIFVRQAYTAGVLIKLFCMLSENQSQSILREALAVTDLGLLLGYPLTNSLDLTTVAKLLTEAIKPVTAEIHSDILKNVLLIPEIEKLEDIKGLHGISVPTVCRPSLETFFKQYFKPMVPVKLTECMDHWPAMKLWKDLTYLLRKAGDRTVPVEIGHHYVHPEWTQKLMPLSNFIKDYVLSSDEGTPVGYLAQHPLFEQVPELKSDIYDPEYCCLSDNDDTEIDVNAWFGPKGTVSPLHFDPKHNLLAQVVGEKRVLMFDPDSSAQLYPHEGLMLSNTAQVDPEEPDYVKFPEFKNVKACECHLKAGEMLYIPPRWWHHVRSLSTSFSVSFWWN